MSLQRLLPLLCILLVCDVGFRLVERLFEGKGLPRALAQAAAGAADKVALATAQGPGNQAFVYVYDIESQRLLVYETGNLGIELKTYDLKLVELPPDFCSKRLTVKQVKELVK